MTTLPPVSAVTAMSERELDAALDEWLFHPNCPAWLRGCHGPAPRYSTSEGSSFFAMLRAVEDAGWVVCIRSGLGWRSVELSKYDERGIRIGHIQPPREATLPLAMARAALMTCYPGGPSE